MIKMLNIIRYASLLMVIFFVFEACRKLKSIKSNIKSIEVIYNNKDIQRSGKTKEIFAIEENTDFNENLLSIKIGGDILDFS